MSKIEFDTEEQQVIITRRIGKTGESTVTLSPEEAGIEINLGIASIGATTDFGGAISLGIAGQEITWGREGGTIHIGIGGFEVDVEARDCIVTEIKSIAGIVVAQRSYPDPGCGPLPEPSKLPEPPQLPGPIDPEGMTSDKLAYVLVEGRYSVANPTGYANSEKNKTIQESNVVAEGVPKDVSTLPSSSSSALLPFVVKSRKTYENTREVYKNGVWVPGTASGSQLHGVNYSQQSQFFWSNNTIKVFPISYVLDLGVPNITGNGEVYPLEVISTVYYGKENVIASYIKSRNRDPNRNYQTNYTTKSDQAIVSRIIYVGRQPTDFSLPTGNKPPMKDCCEEVLDYLEEIREFLAIARFLKDKFPVSNTFMAPECDPTSVTRAENLYEILQCAFRMWAHGMIFEPRVNIKDADAAKAGDQEFKTRYLNATGWASAVAEALLEVKDDGNVSTNMDIRNGFAATQTMVGLADAIYRIDAILDSVGVELIPKTEIVETPYNVQIQIGKGFGEGNERQIDLNTDEATEKLLPSFLQVKKNKIKTVDVHPRSRSIKEILENIEANLSTNNNG